jgi:transcriptional regulator with XRE-family HTH domain
VKLPAAKADIQCEVSENSIGERLRRARHARGEELPSLARRIGVRQEHLQAIEAGRFSELPAGIYGRAAIRSFAAAFGFDAGEILAACEPLLPALEEPISALARLRGLPKPRSQPASDTRTVPQSVPLTTMPGECPSWRGLAAASVDACLVGLLLLIVVIGALTALTVSPSALGSSAVALGVMGVLLGSGYFVWFGGIAGTTVGQRLFQMEAGGRDRPPLTLQTIAARARRSATEDVRFMMALGAWAGRAANARIAPTPALWPSPPPSRDRAPAPLSPASAAGAAPPMTPRLLRDRTPLRWPSTVS